MESKINFENLLKKENDQKVLKIDNEFILKKDETIIFRNIEFNCSFELRIHFPQKMQCLIQENNQNISRNTSYKIDENIKNMKNYLFENCIFNMGIKIHHNNLIFKKSYFKKSIQANLKVKFEECEFEKLYKPLNIIGGKIKELTIKGNISEKFYINKQSKDNDKQLKIENLTISNAVFKDKFKLHNCEINKATLNDIDFENDADFFKSNFKEIENDEIYFANINFNKLVIFEQTHFFKKVIFKYVTFYNYSQFKNAIFEQGLDLELVNIQDDVNFFGIKIKNVENTSQETYRIIKYQFDKIGNKIESNKYHSLELLQNGKNLLKQFKKNKNLNTLQNLVVSFAHGLFSYYSQSWLLVLYWIFTIGWTTSYCLDADNIFKYMLLLTSLKEFNENYLVIIYNKGMLSYLYYQFIVITRKDTRK